MITNTNTNVNMNMNINIDINSNVTKYNVGLGKKSPVRREVVTLPAAGRLLLS